MNDEDEVEMFQDLRSMGTAEGCWKTFEFPMYSRFPSVVRLDIHLEGGRHPLPLQLHPHLQRARGPVAAVRSLLGQDGRGERPCFSHGQFYVAASRVGLPENIMFAIEPNGDGEFRTANVVFAEALILKDI